MKTFLTTLILSALAATAHADATPDYLNLGGPSYHFDERGRRVHGYNETNLGLGLTWEKRDVPVLGEVDLSTGLYRNSQRHTTVYATASKLPLEFLGARWGITGGLVSGYERANVLPMLAPTACWKYACAVVIPPIKDHNTGALSIQFRIPL
jgi:hypothetical protein